MNGSPWVIDASVVAKIYLRDEEFADEARDIVGRHVRGDVELVAPQFILYEIPSAIEAAVRQRRFDRDDARGALRDFFSLGIRTVGDTDTLPVLIEAAFVRAEQLGCRMYDALYLVTAEVLGYEFMTADFKLFQSIRNQVGYALWLGDYRF